MQATGRFEDAERALVIASGITKGAIVAAAREGSWTAAVEREEEAATADFAKKLQALHASARRLQAARGGRVQLAITAGGERPGLGVNYGGLNVTIRSGALETRYSVTSLLNLLTEVTRKPEEPADNFDEIAFCEALA